jgi:RNA polymerase sigma factor (sigma-70 family)
MSKDQENLSVWVNQYTTELYSWALHKVSNADLAADLVQDTFLAAAEKMDGFKGDSSPKTWLFSILNHKIIDHYRKKVNRTVSVEDQSFSNFFDSGADGKKAAGPKTGMKKMNITCSTIMNFSRFWKNVWMLCPKNGMPVLN